MAILDQKTISLVICIIVGTLQYSMYLGRYDLMNGLSERSDVEVKENNKYVHAKCMCVK